MNSQLVIFVWCVALYVSIHSFLYVYLILQIKDTVTVGVVLNIFIPFGKNVSFPFYLVVRLNHFAANFHFCTRI